MSYFLLLLFGVSLHLNPIKSKTNKHKHFDIDAGYPTWDDWIEFGYTNDVSVYLPIVMNSQDDIAEFRNKSKNFWAMYNSITPTAIIECFTEHEIVKTIKFLSHQKSKQMSFTIKAGGHGFGGYNKMEGAAMISVSELKKIKIVDPNEGIISVEPGVNNQEFVQYMIDNNLQHMLYPVGGCPTVAFGGFLTAGGISPFSRSFGLAVDTVVAIRIVLYNGDIIDTYYDNDKDSQYDDLLWAVKGSGGGNFGVITKYYLKAVLGFDDTNKYTRYTNVYYDINQDRDNIYNFFDAISALFEDARFDAVGFLSGNADYSGEQVMLQIFESGFKEMDVDNTEMLYELIDVMDGYMGKPAVNVDIVLFDTYYNVMNVEFEGYPLSTTDFNGMNQVLYITSWRKDMHSDYNEVAGIIADGLGDLIQTFNMKEFSPIRFGYVFEALQGQVMENDANFEHTSFHNRDSFATFHMRFRWDYDEQKGNAIKYMKIVEKNLLNEISNVNYLGYVTNLTGNANLEQYYSNGEIFEKQRRIKAKYDPHNRFKFEMSIPPL